MTIEEVKKKKFEMERALSQIVRDFMTETGVAVYAFEIKIAERAIGLPPTIARRIPLDWKSKIDF